METPQMETSALEKFIKTLEMEMHWKMKLINEENEQQQLFTTKLKEKEKLMMEQHTQIENINRDVSRYLQQLDYNKRNFDGLKLTQNILIQHQEFFEKELRTICETVKKDVERFEGIKKNYLKIWENYQQQYQQKSEVKLYLLKKQELEEAQQRVGEMTGEVERIKALICTFNKTSKKGQSSSTSLNETIIKFVQIKLDTEKKCESISLKKKSVVTLKEDILQRKAQIEEGKKVAAKMQGVEEAAMIGGKGDHLEEHATDTNTCDLKSDYYSEITLKESFGKFPDVLASQTQNESYTNYSEITEKEKGLVPSTLQLSRIYQHPSIQEDAAKWEALPKVCISQLYQTVFQKPSLGEVKDSTGNSMVDDMECTPLPDTNSQFSLPQPDSVHASLAKTCRNDIEATDDLDFSGSNPSVIQDIRFSSKHQEMTKTNEATPAKVVHAAPAKASPAIMVPRPRFSGFPYSDYSHWLKRSDDQPVKPAETMKTNNTEFQSDVVDGSPLSKSPEFTFSSRPMFSFTSNDQDRKEDQQLQKSPFLRPLFGNVSPFCSTMDEKGDHGFKDGSKTTFASGPPEKTFNFPFQPASPSNDNQNDNFTFNFDFDGDNSSARGLNFSSPNDEKAGAMRFNFF
uniref:Protein SIX6OS1 n=1 Tax=Eptatretus burgeri TaxID=7764 RepID=A0A8C4QP26_EPTBU